ncbi:hypothetical protein TNCV_4471291 [Trichonephila clavipes]|uniref:Uncharacterized protein n=1 Tax=Trichonephila clavipes TaxID=2585209 RepID=A0A8X6SGR2_TRICX|nr:hypothetical protein TNCV_4471291 [Trichonephila clavipes]
MEWPSCLWLPFQEITPQPNFPSSARVRTLTGRKRSLRQPAGLEGEKKYSNETSNMAYSTYAPMGTSPGFLLEIKCSYGSQTALARLTTSHLKCLFYDSGRNIHPTCKRCLGHQLHRIPFWDALDFLRGT